MNAISVLQGLIAVILLYFALCAYKKTQINIYRDNLFVARSVLFELPQKYKELSYDSKSYRHMERVLNNNIRFAHKLSFLQLFFFYQVLKRKKPSVLQNNNIKKEMKNLSPQLQKEFEKIQEMANGHIIEFLLKTSPIFFIYFTMNRKRTYTSSKIETEIKINPRIYKAVNIMAGEDHRYELAA